MTKNEYCQVAPLIDIRLSDIAVNNPGSRSTGFTIATTFLDIVSHPSAWLGSVFLGRWMVETDIEWIKCTIGVEHLRGQSPDNLERELWTGMMTYNMVRMKMLQGGHAAGREHRSMSFTETYQLLSTNWLLCACTGVSEAMSQSAQQQSLVAVIGHRPDRCEPRENKRRPKVLKLMTVPRRMFHAALDAAYAALSKVT